MCTPCGNDTMDDMITVKNLTKRYGDYVAVDDVSFTVGRGETLAVVGESGSGKSTTLAAMIDVATDAPQATGGAH